MILEQCKAVHYVDLGESFQPHIFLQNLASIQPRTSPMRSDISGPPGSAPWELDPIARGQTRAGAAGSSCRRICPQLRMANFFDFILSRGLPRLPKSRSRSLRRDPRAPMLSLPAGLPVGRHPFAPTAAEHEGHLQ